MKAVLWVTAGVLLLLWTGGAWAVASLTQWLVSAAASAQATELGQGVADWPVPPWLALWVDAGVIQATKDAVAWAIELMRGSGPIVENAIAWLVPLLWVAWALGAAVLATATVAAHWAIGRFGPRPPRQPRPAA